MEGFAMIRRWICAALLLLAALTTPAFAEKRVALVTGNSAYAYAPRLTNPANDARLMSETLRALGFTLVGGGAQLDLDIDQFRHVMQDFGNALQGADVGLFYHAGDRIQMHGANYLVPVGANPSREFDVDLQMLDSSVVLRQMEGAGPKLSMMLLDACRNNPFGGRGLRATSGGLAQMQAPEGTLISFATQPGAVAQDGIDETGQRDQQRDQEGGHAQAAVSTCEHVNSACERASPGEDGGRAAQQAGPANDEPHGQPAWPWSCRSERQAAPGLWHRGSVLVVSGGSDKGFVAGDLIVGISTAAVASIADLRKGIDDVKSSGKKSACCASPRMPTRDLRP
jgi:hypothetical protein